MSKITKRAMNIRAMDNFFYQNRRHTALEDAKTPDDHDFVVIKSVKSDGKRTYIIIKKNESLEIPKF